MKLEPAAPDDPFAMIAPLPQVYAWLPFGQVRPRGWIAQQLRQDLEHGFVGHLDELVPSLIRDDDLYGASRLSLQVTRKDLGVLGATAAWQVQYLWWNSETQSNWRDGMVRTTLLLDHPEYLGRVRAYIAQILASQDADGYLGIYGPDLRYQLRGENGELWAQASLFRVLLGYAEATSDQAVLQAVERAVQRTMAGYGPGSADPFAVQEPYAGVSHGLMLTDALERLAQLTDDDRYAHYALWLYQAFSQSAAANDDASYARLRESAAPFQGHGVHTYEHLRALLVASYTSGSPLLQQALDDYLVKLERCLAPSGGPIGDEWISGRTGDARSTGYEYCSIHELLDSYTHLLQKTGAASWGDRAEWLLFNAGQGARHPARSAIAYLKTDTSTSMTGKLHPDDPDDPAHPQTRYKYSPAHQDVAVCCVPNAGRIYPYYVKAMWLRCHDGLAAALYGPCELHTEVNGVAVHIRERTAYPLDCHISLAVTVAAPVAFTLRLRRPQWATGHSCVLAGQPFGEEIDGWIIIQHSWEHATSIELHFDAQPELIPYGQGELIVRCGPLLFVRPIASRERPGRAYPLPGFVDSYAEPDLTEPGSYAIDPDQAAPQLVHEPHPGEPTWEAGPRIDILLLHPQTRAATRVRLVPMGASLLRQASFPVS
jgi:hypothetical protein